MSEQINDGGTAFHSITIKGGDNYNAPTKCYHKGMSLRDWFAGQALVGLLSGPAEEGATTPDLKAVVAYQFADAMLKARGGAK